MKKEHFLWAATKTGLLGGAIGIFLCLIGMVEIFDKRDVIEGLITLGQFILLTTAASVGFIASRRTTELLGQNQPSQNLIAGLVAGLVTGLVISLLVVIGGQIDLRAVFLNASPALYSLLTFNQGLGGVWILPLVGAVIDLTGAAFLLLK